MKHNKVSSIAIASTIVAAALMGPGSNGFAQNAYTNRVVQGMFGPRVMGQPMFAPPRQLTDGAAVGLNGQPLNFERTRGGLFPSGTGWPLGGIASSALLPQPMAISPPGGMTLNPVTGLPTVGIGPGGALYPTQPNGTSPSRATQAVTGAPPETQGAPAGTIRSGPTTNAAGQNVANLPGQTVPPGTLPVPGTTLQPGQSAGAPGPAWTPGQTVPAAASATPATSAAEFVPRTPAPWALGFTPAPSGVASASLTARLENSRQIQKRSPIAVTLQRDTAVIRGRVATEHDRDLAGAMLLLEPGVLQVKNELVVESPPPAPHGVSAR